MVEKYSIIWIYHILFIHSSVDGLGLFPFFGFMKDAATNIPVTSFHMDVFNSLGVELLGHMVLCLTF